MVLKYILIITLSLFTNCLLAQAENNLPPSPKSNPKGPDVLPKFPGGDSLMYVFVQNNSPFKVFRKAEIKNASSLTYISFLVNKDGSLTNIQVIKSSNEEHKSTLINAVKKMPNWQPAEMDGKIIPYQVAIVVGLGNNLQDN